MIAAPALPQAQTGLATIFAALGPAMAADSDGGGFEQVLAELPGSVATGTGASAAGPTALTPPSNTPVPAAPTAGVDGETDMVLPMATTLPTAPLASAIVPLRSQPGAASVQISDANTAAGNTAAGATPPEAAAEQPAAPAAKPSETAPEPDAAAAASLLIAVATAANAGPTSTGRSTKTPEAPTTARRSTTATTTLSTTAAKTAPTPDAFSAAPTRPAMTESAALPVATAKPAADPAPFRPAVDGGASMAVLFGQPVAPGIAAPAFAQTAAPVAERLLDMGSDDQWIAQLAADIAATKSETGDLSFRLMPRHLGRLDVAMKMDDGGGVSLRLDAQHEATATIVTAAQPRLVEDLRQQGVRVAEAQVTHTPAETGRQQQQQGQSGRGAAPNASHLIETAPERPGADRNERAADRRGRFA